MSSLRPPLERCLDGLLASIVTIGLTMAVVTAMPGTAQAQTPPPTKASSGQGTTEQRTVASFDAIEISGAFDVKVRQASQPSLEVKAQADLLPLIETTVENGKTLRLRWKPQAKVWHTGKVSIDVGAVTLSSLASSGSSDVRVETFNTPKLAAAVSGSGDLQLKGLTTQELNLVISGSGDVAAQGQANKLSVRIAGSGDVKAPELKADNVTIRIAGSGGAVVHADKTLEVSIAGSGDVRFSGNAEVKSSVAGSGSVSRR